MRSSKEMSAQFVLRKFKANVLAMAAYCGISEYPGFKNSNIPEINDVWISAEHRGNGFGKRLIQHLEGISRQKNHKQIGIGVGLYKDYGSCSEIVCSNGIRAR